MRSKFVSILVVGVLGVALCAGQAGASADPGAWTPLPTPNPLTATGYLNAVSCGSVGNCVSVGYFADGQGDVVPLAEASTGAATQLVPPVVPPGAGLSVLNAVSCSTDGTCEAVGFYNDAANNAHSFAERYAGGSWTLQTVPGPVGARDAGLLGLECESPTDCVAVGNYTDASGDSLVLGEQWNGVSWTPQYVTSPGPIVAVASQLDAITCSGVNCTAVGSYHTAAGANVPLIELHDGSGWHEQVAATPDGTVDANLLGVSCDDTGACTAVGFATDDMGNEQVLADQRATPAGVWQLSSVPTGTQQNPMLAAIACQSAVDCTAAGSSSIGTLIEHWNGTKWTRQLAGAALRSGGTGIACPSESSCVTVGYALSSNKIPSPLIDVFNGVGWQVDPAVPAPDGAVTADLSAVSCSSPGLCTAVGDQTSANGLVDSALVARLQGGAWTTQSVNGASSLVGVSCADDTHCVAAGYHFANGSSTSVIEAWNGGSWGTRAVPVVSGSTGSDLRAVSCASATSCMAVGEYSDADGNTFALAIQLTGRQWVLRPLPLPKGTAFAQLTGVSCIGSRCTVVGSAGTAHGKALYLIEVWDGTSWAVQHPAVPAGAVNLNLQQVSCPSASSCTLSGSYIGGEQGIESSLVERRTGVTWAVVPTPNPADVVSSTLRDISCPTTGSCAAVGDDYGLGPSGLPAPEQPLAETFDGMSWGLQSIDTPAGTNSAALSGVSCTGGQCVAVGYRFASSGRMVTLAVSS